MRMTNEETIEIPYLPSFTARLCVTVGFFVVSLLIYGGSLHNAFVRLDDGLLIYENQAIQHINPETLKTIFTTYDPELYIPLTFLSYQIDYALGGIDPFIYHVQNLFWHTLNALLVMWLAFLLLKREWPAVFVGLLFLVHPLHAEAVAWAAARKDVLATFFFLSSIIAYLYYRAHDVRKWYVLSMGLFALGLMAKVVIVTLPLILVLIDDVQHRTWNKRMILDKLPFIGLSIVFGVIALLGKQALLSDVTPWQLFLLSSTSAVFMLWKLIWPFGYSVLYPFDGTITLVSPLFLLPLLGMVLALAAAFWWRKKSRWPWFALLFFLITLAPTVTNLVKQVIFLGSDRYAYIPSISLFLLVGLACVVWTQAHMRQRSQPMLIASCILIIGLGMLALRQSRTWLNTETLFLHTLSVYPDSFVAHNNLGNVYYRQGKINEAEQEFLAAVKAHPTAEIHTNLGGIYLKQRKFEEARMQFKTAIDLDSTRVQGYMGLASIAIAEGNTTSALQLYADALANGHDLVQVYINRGVLFKNVGQLEEALEDFTEAIKVEPHFMQAHYNAAITLEKLGRTDEAKKAYEEAVYLQPWYIPVRINLGLLLFQLGDSEGSKKQFEAILQYDPQNKAALQAIEQLRIEN